jgi:hypothetical protein
VVEQHKLTVLLGDLVLGQFALTINGKKWLESSIYIRPRWLNPGKHTKARGSKRPRGGSCVARNLCTAS